MIDDPFIDPDELRRANEAHDAAMRSRGLNIKSPGRVGSGWKPQSMIRRGKLTDKKIAKYSQEGWYSDEFKAARKQRMNQRIKRNGAFVEVGGRWVYSPI